MLSGTCGENLTWTLDGDTLTISGAGDMEEYNTFSKDRAPWFERRDLIKRIVIADGVTKIGLFAFEYCKNLTEIKIPASVAEIDWYAFLGCENLPEIKIPASVTYIGDSAFALCASLKEIKIPDGIERIGRDMFSDCTRLKRIYYKADSGFEEKLREGNDAELIPY